MPGIPKFSSQIQSLTVYEKFSKKNKSKTDLPVKMRSNGISIRVPYTWQKVRNAQEGIFWPSGGRFHLVTQINSFFRPPSLFHYQPILCSSPFLFLPFPRSFIYLATIWGVPNNIKDTALKSVGVGGGASKCSSPTANI